MVAKCAVPGCGTRYRRYDPPKFFTVPHNKIKREAWLSKCTFLQRPTTKGIDNLRICSRHFLPNHINSNDKFTFDAIPSLHLPAKKNCSETNINGHARVKPNICLQITPLKFNEPLEVTVMYGDLNDLKTSSNLSTAMTSVASPESQSIEMPPKNPQSILKPVNEESADSIIQSITRSDNIVLVPNICDDLNIANIELIPTSETNDSKHHASGKTPVTSTIDPIYNIFVLYDGYSYLNESNNLIANCTCTLIKGPKNIIIDTMTSWDTKKIIDGLKNHDLSPHQIEYVVSTHGHSDHIGNNNLFHNARHIVGFSISHKDTYFPHPFDKGIEYIIDENIKVIPTPGHTLSDVTVLLNTGVETVAVVGDLFENVNDIFYPNIWLDAGSEDPEQQQINRIKVAELADWIVPGHGPKFRVTDDIRHVLRQKTNIKNEDNS